MNFYQSAWPNSSEKESSKSRFRNRSNKSQSLIQTSSSLSNLIVNLVATTLTSRRSITIFKKFLPNKTWLRSRQKASRLLTKSMRISSKGSTPKTMKSVYTQSMTNSNPQLSPKKKLLSGILTEGLKLVNEKRIPRSLLRRLKTLIYKK